MNKPATPPEVQRPTRYEPNGEPWRRPVYTCSEADALFESLEAKLLSAEQERGELKVKLEEMTKDRDLWQEAHDEDCPNKIHVDSLKAENQAANQRADEAFNDGIEAAAQRAAYCDYSAAKWIRQLKRPTPATGGTE